MVAIRRRAWKFSLEAMNRGRAMYRRHSRWRRWPCRANASTKRWRVAYAIRRRATRGRLSNCRTGSNRSLRVRFGSLRPQRVIPRCVHMAAMKRGSFARSMWSACESVCAISRVYQRVRRLLFSCASIDSRRGVWSRRRSRKSGRKLSSMSVYEANDTSRWRRRRLWRVGSRASDSVRGTEHAPLFGAVRATLPL